MRYSVVIVTFNRLNLLKECINNALNQSISPEKVIVVNNASTDGTKEFLDEYQKNESRLLVHHEQENIGGSGGFHDALKPFMENDSDWVMIIDDDAILNPDCIEVLKNHIDKYQTRACATSVVTDGQYTTFHRRDFNDAQDVNDYKKEAFDIDLASFCGLFLHREIIKEIGLPEKDYFIWYDDTEYCYRISQYTKITVVPNAILDHKTVLPKPAEGFSLGWKDYYGIRNSIHMLKKHKDYESLKKRLHYILIVWLRCLKRGKKFSIERKMCTKAIIDGFSGKLGKNELYLPGKPLGKKEGNR